MKVVVTEITNRPNVIGYYHCYSIAYDDMRKVCTEFWRVPDEKIFIERDDEQSDNTRDIYKASCFSMAHKFFSIQIKG